MVDCLIFLIGNFAFINWLQMVHHVLAFRFCFKKTSRGGGSDKTLFCEKSTQRPRWAVKSSLQPHSSMSLYIDGFYVRIIFSPKKPSEKPPKLRIISLHFTHRARAPCSMCWLRHKGEKSMTYADSQDIGQHLREIRGVRHSDSAEFAVTAQHRLSRSTGPRNAAAPWTRCSNPARDKATASGREWDTVGFPMKRALQMATAVNRWQMATAVNRWQMATAVDRWQMATAINRWQMIDWKSFFEKLFLRKSPWNRETWDWNRGKNRTIKLVIFTERGGGCGRLFQLR